MNDSKLRDSMKRRTFFASVVFGGAGTFAVFPFLRSWLHPGFWLTKKKRKIEVTINPLAVPRVKKGNTSNG